MVGLSCFGSCFRELPDATIYDNGEARRWRCKWCQWWRDIDETCACNPPRRAPVEDLKRG